MPSGVETTGFATIRTGICAGVVERCRDAPGVLGDPLEDLVAVQVLAPRHEPRLELAQAAQAILMVTVRLRSLDGAAEEAGHVVPLQQQVDADARDDRDRDAGLQHPPVGAAEAGLRRARPPGSAAA